MPDAKQREAILRLILNRQVEESVCSPGSVSVDEKLAKVSAELLLWILSYLVLSCQNSQDYFLHPYLWRRMDVIYFATERRPGFPSHQNMLTSLFPFTSSDISSMNNEFYIRRPLLCNARTK